MTEHAQAAKQIKAKLQKAFPGIRFSARSSSFSMGDDVNVSWTDGPTVKEVESLINCYQYGHFDGMTDMYENSNDRNDIPQSKYVFANRTLSKEYRAKIVAKINSLQETKIQLDDRGYVINRNDQVLGEWPDTVIWKMAENTFAPYNSSFNISP